MDHAVTMCALCSFLQEALIMIIVFQGAMDVLRLLFGTKSLRPVSLARELYRRDLLESFIRENAEKQYNIVLLGTVA